MNDTWNPWHGCRKISAGCQNCYVYRHDAKYDIDSTAVVKNKSFYAPAERYKYGNYKMNPPGRIIYTCFTSDFFLDDADKWRGECWQMIKQAVMLHSLLSPKGFTDLPSVSPMIGEMGMIMFIYAVPAKIRKRQISDFLFS